MTRKKPNKSKTVKTNVPKTAEKPKQETPPAKPAEPKLSARTINYLRIRDVLGGSHFTLTYLDGKLTEDEFCGEHSCYRENAPIGRIKWRNTSPEDLVVFCVDCYSQMPFLSEIAQKLPSPHAVPGPMGKVMFIATHLCVRCKRDLEPNEKDLAIDDPAKFRNLCDECKNISGNGN